MARSDPRGRAWRNDKQNIQLTDVARDPTPGGARDSRCSGPRKRRPRPPRQREAVLAGQDGDSVLSRGPGTADLLNCASPGVGPQAGLGSYCDAHTRIMFQPDPGAGGRWSPARPPPTVVRRKRRGCGVQDRRPAARPVSPSGAGGARTTRRGPPGSVRARTKPAPPWSGEIRGAADTGGHCANWPAGPGPAPWPEQGKDRLVRSVFGRRKV